MLKTSARDKVESRLSRSPILRVICVENQCQGQGRVSVVQEFYVLKTSARNKVESRLSRSRCVENQCQGEGRVSVVQASIRCVENQCQEQGRVSVVQESILRVDVLKTSARTKVESRLSRSLF